jgi:hypothetical protein
LQDEGGTVEATMPSLADVFRTLNEMKAESVVIEYAIGGAMAALFYAEVTRTYDIDVFAYMPSQAGPILDMTGLYAWARNRGFGPDAEHLMIHTVPVQFLPANEGLEQEAVMEAQTFEYGGEPVRVMRPEHLVALYTRAGGAGRRERAILLLKTGVVDVQELNALLQRYNLVDAWNKIQTEDAQA